MCDPFIFSVCGKVLFLFYKLKMIILCFSKIILNKMSWMIQTYNQNMRAINKYRKLSVDLKFCAYFTQKLTFHWKKIKGNHMFEAFSSETT